MHLVVNLARIEQIQLAGSGLERDLDLAALAAIKPILPTIDNHLAQIAADADAELDNRESSCRAAVPNLRGRK